MLIRTRIEIPSREITEPSVYLRRRELLERAALGSLALGLGALALPGRSDGQAAEPTESAGRRKLGPYDTDEDVTPRRDATSYNNFYEFGTDKTDPARLAGSLQTRPWAVAIEGEVEKPGVIDIDDLLRPHTLEDRIYRLRCVEAWSMVIPWRGIPLGELLKRFEPTEKAQYVAFETLFDPKQMPGQKRPVIKWPYREGLRMDEAMHPLTLLAVGMYGEVLPNQNGAPLRLVVPWKYGFKSIKSIVKIKLQKRRPRTSWSQSAPQEYGFFANVNPEVDHPRWSQSRERRIGEFFKRKTLPFNGYAEQVAHLYAGMNLRRHY